MLGNQRVFHKPGPPKVAFKVPWLMKPSARRAGPLLSLFPSPWSPKPLAAAASANPSARARRQAEATGVQIEKR